MKLFFACALLLPILMSCAQKQIVQKAITEPTTEAGKLQQIISQYTEASKHLDAYDAHYFNVEEDLGKFGDYLSSEYLLRDKNIKKSALESIKKIDPTKLTGEDLTTYKLFFNQTDRLVRGFQFPAEDLSFNQMYNRLSDYLDLANPDLTGFPFDSKKHYIDFIQRSEGFQKFVDNQIAVLKKGIKEKVTLNCIAAKTARNSYEGGLEKQIEKNPFWKPIAAIPASLSIKDVEEIKNGFRLMIKDRIIPGYKKFDEFYTVKYLPHCNKHFGISALPNGVAWYEYAIESGTTLKLKAQDLHKLGLEQVAKLEVEEKSVQKSLGNNQPLPLFLKSLAKDPSSYYKTSKELFNAFLDAKNKIQKTIPSYFELIPISDYDVVEASNSEAAAGQYSDPTEMRPRGKFIVNTKNLLSVPKYQVTTLSLHEAVPGHHFQLALQFEMKDKLSEFRRKMFNANSFVEGWAHYAEYLGNEMGVLTDPMQKLGYLDDQMLRAVRLVVDTGIHYYNWDKQKAVKYMTDHLATDAKGVDIEINRYSVWPGQALGYKVGQLKILELRHWAEQKLGSKFNIKDFHRAVIGNGTVSLPVLEDQVNAWVESQI